MNIKSLLNKLFSNHIFIVIVFAVMSIMSAAFMWHARYVFLGADLYFHWQRIYDLKQSIGHGNLFPLVALNQFHQAGTAVMGLYPKMNLYPMLLLTYVIKSFVPLFYVTFIARNFIGMLIAYISSYSYNHSKKSSFVFSISYTLTSMIIFHAIQDYDIGISSSVLFIPLIMFGFMELLKRNRWIELTVGMTAVILCHVLNSVIVALFLLIFLVMNYKDIFKKDKMIALSKAIVTTLLITSFFIVPFIIIMGHNPISMPASFWHLGGTTFNTLLSTALDNNIDASISLTMLLGLILGFVNYKKLNKYTKQLLWIAVIFLIICSDLFPWSIMDRTALHDILQFSWRLYIIPEVILAYVFSEVIFTFFDKRHNKLILVAVAFAVVTLQAGAQQTIVNTSADYPIIKKNNFMKLQAMKVNSNKSFSKVINNTWTITDYYPKNALPVIQNTVHHVATYGKKKIKFRVHRNGKYSFNSTTKVKKLALPFLHYNGINYEVKLDGKTVKAVANKHSLLTISNVAKGHHNIQIIVHRTKAEIASYIATIIGLALLIFAIVRQYIFKKNK